MCRYFPRNPYDLKMANLSEHNFKLLPVGVYRNSWKMHQEIHLKKLQEICKKSDTPGAYSLGSILRNTHHATDNSPGTMVGIQVRNVHGRPRRESPDARSIAEDTSESAVCDKRRSARCQICLRIVGERELSLIQMFAG